MEKERDADETPLSFSTRTNRGNRNSGEIAKSEIKIKDVFDANEI